MEGYVTLKFDISKDGKLINIKLVETYPPSIFTNDKYGRTVNEVDGTKQPPIHRALFLLRGKLCN